MAPTRFIKADSTSVRAYRRRARARRPPQQLADSATSVVKKDISRAIVPGATRTMERGMARKGKGKGAPKGAKAKAKEKVKARKAVTAKEKGRGESAHVDFVEYEEEAEDWPDDEWEAYMWKEAPYEEEPYSHGEDPSWYDDGWEDAGGVPLVPVASSSATNSTLGPSASAVIPATPPAFMCMVEEVTSEVYEGRDWVLSIAAEHSDELEQIHEYTDRTNPDEGQMFSVALSTPAYKKEAFNTQSGRQMCSKAFSAPACKKEAFNTQGRRQMFSKALTTPACSLDSIEQELLLDSGASHHVAPPTWMQHVPLEKVPLAQQVSLRTAEGSPLAIIGMRKVRYKLPGVRGTAVSRLSCLRSDKADSERGHSRERRTPS